MPRGRVDGQELKVVRIFPRRLPSGNVNYTARMELSIENSRVLEVDRALQELQHQNPGESLSALVCNALIEVANKLRPPYLKDGIIN